MHSQSIAGSMIYNGQAYRIAPGRHCIDEKLTATLMCSQMGDGIYSVLYLKNTGSSDTALIEEVRTLDITMPGSDARYHTLFGDSCGEKSFLPRTLDITMPYQEEPTGGRSSAETGFPFFDIRCGDISMAAAIGWTGQWVKELYPVQEGCRVRLGVAETAFVLHPGEEVRLASVLVAYADTPEAARAKLRSALRKELPENTTLPIAIQCFDRYFQGLGNTPKDPAWATEQGQKRVVDGCGPLRHVDTLWLDAAWFKKGFPNGVGNYSYGDGFPNGLRPVSDYAREKGMDFLLWFEPERVYYGTEMFEQTEKLLSAPDIHRTRVYNLGDDAARNALAERLIAMIRDNQIAVYRQDCNITDLQVYWRANDEPGRRGMTEIRYINGLYQLWDALQASCPGLRIDNCASGGRRLDLETMRRSVALWRSDTGCFPESDQRRNSVWNQNQILTLSEYLPYHACAVWEVDTYTVRSAQTQGIACNFDIYALDFDFRQGERVLREVREMRPYWAGDFYPLTTPTTDESVWAAYQLALEEKGAVYAFRRERCKQACRTFQLKAIDPTAEYTVEQIDDAFHVTTYCISGTALAAGLTVQIPQPRGSVIVRYQRMSAEHSPQTS